MLQPGKANDISGLITAADVPTTVATPSVVVGKPFIDYVSFHYYGSSDTRDKVIFNIHNPGPGKIKQIMAPIASFCNSPTLTAIRGGQYPLQMVITEANLITTTATAVDANSDSFLRGQWWADFASICLPAKSQFINYWSSAESTFGSLNTSGQKRPSYHHYKMMADNFKGTFTPTTSINIVGVGTPTAVKAFAAKSGDRVAVMILNQQNGGGSFTF